MLLKKLEALVRTIYCEGPPNGYDLDMLPFQLRMIAILGLFFTLWNTVNLVVDIGQGFKLIFSRYFIGGVLLLAGCAFGIVHRRRGDSLMRGDGLLWAPMGQDPEYYMSRLSGRRQQALRAIFCLLFTEVSIFLFQDAVLLQVWIFAKDAYDEDDAFDLAAAWITCLSAGITFVLLTFSLVVASYNLHWMPGFCQKMAQIVRAVVFIFVFLFVYLFLMGLVIMQITITAEGDSTGGSLVGIGSPEAVREEGTTNGASALFSVFFLWILGSFFSCRLRNQAANPRSLVPMAVSRDIGDVESGKSDGDDPPDATETADDELDDTYVCFGRLGHPGTKAYVQVVRQVVQAIPKNQDFNDKIFQHILSKAKGRQFFVKATTHTWRHADNGEIEEETYRLFAKEQAKVKREGSNSTESARTSSLKSETKSMVTSPLPQPDIDKIDPMDICLECSSHPGSRRWHTAIKKFLDEFPDAKYSPEVYQSIKRQFQHREFWIYKASAWQRASISEIVSSCQNSFEEAQNEVFVDLVDQEEDRQASNLLPKNDSAGTFDICFGCMLYPGTRSWHLAIQQSLDKFPDETFSHQVYKHIKDQFQGRRFWIYKDDEWKLATESEKMSNCRDSFEEYQKVLFDVIVDGS